MVAFYVGSARRHHGAYGILKLFFMVGSHTPVSQCSFVTPKGASPALVAAFKSKPSLTSAFRTAARHFSFLHNIPTVDYTSVAAWVPRFFTSTVAAREYFTS